MESETLIRAAHPADLDGVMELQARSYSAALQESRALFERMLALSPDTCLVASSGAALAGYVFAYPIPADHEKFGTLPESCERAAALYLHDLCVSPDHRGKNLARALHDGLIRAFTPGRFRKITAVAVQDSTAFWQRCGFTAGATYAYPGGAPGVLLTKDL